MTVSIVGLGYIGLPTALLLADNGVKVCGYDLDIYKRTTLLSGKVPFNEVGLTDLFYRVLSKKTFKIMKALESADAYLVAVPTPQIGGEADLRFICDALDSIKSVFQENQLIIIESTVGPRDCVDKLIPTIKTWGKKFRFVHCPERAIPGNTLHEMVNNDRIIGAEVEKDAMKGRKLYASFVRGKIYLTSTTVAASAKVMENTYRTVNIALANELAVLAEKLHFNVWEAIELANKHPRVNLHSPGPGVGGHCLPVDPWFFVKTNQAPLIKRALEVNENMPLKIGQRVTKLIKQHQLKSPTIGVLGYAYKRNVDDARETPAQALIDFLIKKYQVVVNDPHVRRPEFVNLEDLLSQAKVVVLVTDHDEYQDLKFKHYPNIKFIYDTRRLFREKNLEDSQATLYTLGRS